ncbi:unnamed protein product [Durusdinium trenchii]|uniref:Uncharacterized protein n=1 Tax=Durusdinium trenchii TaxID=1381693 RepID=A0ABP0SDC1_9DINO
MLMMMMRRNDRTHQIRDSTGQTDARANDVISYRRDVLQQTAIRFFIREKEDARASSATPRRPKLEEQPLSSRSEPTELTKKDQPNEQPRQTSDPIHHKDKVNISSTALGLERADSSLSVPDVNMASTTAPSSNQSISTGTMSLGIGVAPNLEPFEPIAEVSEAEDRRTQSTQRSGSHSQNRIKVPTVNSLGSSRACDLDLQSSESLRFQDQMVWLYGSSPGSSNSLLQPPHDSHAGGKRSIGTVNSLASSEALNVGDVGRFRRTETLQLSNERRDAAAKEAATLALLKELQKEQQKRNSNSLDSLASSWLEIDSGQESRQLSASPEGRDAENLEPALDFPDLPERRSQALALPLSRSRQGSRQGRRPVLSVASLENIEEAMDEDGSFQFPSKLGADRQPLRSARMSSLAPKILEKDPVTIPSFESPGQ